MSSNPIRWIVGLFMWVCKKRTLAFAKYAERYSAQIVGRVEALAASGAEGFTGGRAAQLVSDAQAAAKQPADDKQWDVFHQIELLLLAKEPEPDLLNDVLLLEAEYREIFGKGSFESLLAGRFPAAKGTAAGSSTPELDLRSWAATLSEELHYQYNVLWILEEQRRRQRALVLLALGFWGVLVGVLWLLRAAGHVPFLWACLGSVAGAGGVGAVTLILRRLQIQEWTGNPDKMMLDVDEAGWLLVFKTVVAAIFALLLYFLFAGKILEGALFPTFVADPERGCAYCLVPPDGSNLVKLLFWAFMAGYSEKLVPSKLDQLEKQASEEKK